MNAIPRLLRLLLVFALAVLGVSGMATAGTIVRFEVNTGSFDVELLDDTMPTTVANFLGYVNAGAYGSTIFHRTTTYNPAIIQVVQGGGFGIEGSTIFPIATNPPIGLEMPSPSNLRGTIAMARGEELDSATSQFYFNVQDNPGLDGAYAVFGSVVGTAGLAALDALAGLEAFNLSSQLGPAFGEMPLIPVGPELYQTVFVSSVAVVPEPSSLLLAACGVAAAAAYRCRGRRLGR